MPHNGFRCFSTVKTLDSFILIHSQNVKLKRVKKKRGYFEYCRKILGTSVQKYQLLPLKTQAEET